MVSKFQKLYIVFILIFSLSVFQSCGVVKTGRRGHTSTKIYKKTKVNNSISHRAKSVLDEAHSYLGTPYQYGGTTKQGMDCSGLLLNAYQQVNIQLPRVSRDQAKHGVKVRLSKVQPGDALFFKIGGNTINHAGIVDHIDNGEIFFIHASSSRGVMVSSLDLDYWKKSFVKAVRYIH